MLPDSWLDFSDAIVYFLGAFSISHKSGSLTRGHQVPSVEIRATAARAFDRRRRSQMEKCRDSAMAEGPD